MPGPGDSYFMCPVFPLQRAFVPQYFTFSESHSPVQGPEVSVVEVGTVPHVPAGASGDSSACVQMN